jgi:hypothetical protein
MPDVTPDANGFDGDRDGPTKELVEIAATTVVSGIRIRALLHVGKPN